MTYTTQPGTIPHRVLEYFKGLPPGTEKNSAALVDDLDIDRYALVPTLEPAVQAGLLVRRKIAGERSLRWSLGDGVPLARERDEPIRKEPVVEMRVRKDGALELAGVRMWHGRVVLRRPHVAQLRALLGAA